MEQGLAIVALAVTIGLSVGVPLLLHVLGNRRRRARKGWQKAAAARALGAVGTIAAVEPLLTLGKKGLLENNLEKACREAISAIQARLGGADAGRLSLAAPLPGEGALSLSTSGGEVSFPTSQERSGEVRKE